MTNAIAEPVPSQPFVRAATPTLNALRVRAGAQTHVGKVRRTNEDQFLIGDITSAIQVRRATLCESNHLYLGSTPLCLLVVADGMGGHAGGEHAAALAVTSVESFILRALGHIGTLGIRGPADLLRASFQIADGTVIEAAEKNDSLAGMGTTMTVAMIGGSEAHVAHAGDSRAYLLRERALRRLTRDHTVAEALREGGVIKTPSEMHPLHHVITNAVGGGTAGVNPDISRVDLNPGDRLLLCTDGLTNMVDDNRIAEILASELEPTELSQRLVDEALACGGEDNTTVVVAFLDAA